MMKKSIDELIKPAFRLLLLFTIICGGIYTLLVTGIGQFVFPKQTNGSLITVETQDGGTKVIGSELLGQPFSEAAYLIGRPGQTASQLSPVSHEQTALVNERVKQFQEMDPEKRESVPLDLVTASASGVDPDIFYESALYQAPRIAKARNITEEEVIKVIEKHTTGELFGTIGTKRVNVLAVNVALDQLETQ